MRDHKHKNLSLADIKGLSYVKEAMAVAAAGRHNILLFGPHASGKTMAAMRFINLLPPLEYNDSFEVSKRFIKAALFKPGAIQKPPFRHPDCTSTLQAMTGGGKTLNPGEIFLSHKGVLLLDKISEFKKNILYLLTEIHNSENADIQLILTSYACPCGNMGMPDKVCICSGINIRRYWKSMGRNLLDLIDIRIPLIPVDSNVKKRFESEKIFFRNIKKGVEIQEKRFKGEKFDRNSRITAEEIPKYIKLDSDASEIFLKAVKKFSLSKKSCNSIMKIARTCSDMDGNEKKLISRDSLLRAIQMRRYCDNDYFWYRKGF